MNCGLLLLDGIKDQPKCRFLSFIIRLYFHLFSYNKFHNHYQTSEVAHTRVFMQIDKDKQTRMHIRECRRGQGWWPLGCP
jgi:hypothetical protein